MKKSRYQINQDYINTHKDQIKKQQDKWRKTLNGRISLLFYSIKTRCNNSNSTHYKWYGGKGIKCLLKKKDLMTLWHRDSADKMKNPSINRINPEGNYSFENCEFVEKNYNGAKLGLKSNLNIHYFRDLTKEEKRFLIDKSIKNRKLLSETIGEIIKDYIKKHN